MTLTLNLNPLQGPTHTLTPIINKHTEQVKKICMDLSWHAVRSRMQVRTAIHGFQKKIHTYPPKPTEEEPSFREVNLPSVKADMLFTTHL